MVTLSIYKLTERKEHNKLKLKMQTATSVIQKYRNNKDGRGQNRVQVKGVT